MGIFVADLNLKEMTEEDWDKFQEAMDKCAEQEIQIINGIATDLNVTQSCAADILYLRGRSYWTQELEDKLIALHKTGADVNVFQFCDQNVG